MPTDEFPPTTPFTLQVTEVLEVRLTVAVNWNTWLVNTVADVGDMLTRIGGAAVAGARRHRERATNNRKWRYVIDFIEQIPLILNFMRHPRAQTHIQANARKGDWAPITTSRLISVTLARERVEREVQAYDQPTCSV